MFQHIKFIAWVPFYAARARPLVVYWHSLIINYSSSNKIRTRPTADILFRKAPSVATGTGLVQIGRRQKIDAGVKTAVASALEEHRRAGRSVVVWNQGKVVTMRPDEIGHARR